MARRWEVGSRGRGGSDRGGGYAGPTHVRVLEAGGLTHSGLDGGFALGGACLDTGPADVRVLLTRGVTLTRPDGLLAPSWTGRGLRRRWGRGQRRRGGTVEREALTTDVYEGVTGGITLTCLDSGLHRSDKGC